MYNLLVTAQDGAWDKTEYEYPRVRFLEYTDDEIATRFQELKDAQIKTLLKLPCLFIYEGRTEAVRLGRLLDIRPRRSDLFIKYEISQNVPPIPFDRIAPIQRSLDIRNPELSRTHWAIKDEDLLEILNRENLIPVLQHTQNVRKNDLPPLEAPGLTAETVGDFVNKVLSLDHGSREAFYRGHSNRARYRLEPSLFRKDEKGNLKYLDSEEKMYRELLISNPTDFQGDTYTVDRLVRMQHYSLPTRLLDITSNPLIALYFACTDKPEESEDGEVIALSIERDRIKYFDSDTASCIANLARLPKESKELIDYSKANLQDFNEQQPVQRLLHFIKEEKPYFEDRIIPDHLRSVLCVKGKHSNSRIAFQSGAFLLFGQDALLDENGTDEISLRRIAVRSGAKGAILRQLDQLNINASTVFPYIESSAKYIAEKFLFRV